MHTEQNCINRFELDWSDISANKRSYDERDAERRVNPSDWCNRFMYTTALRRETLRA